MGRVSSPREFVPSRTRPKRAAAGGSRERPSTPQLYGPDVNEPKAWGKCITLRTLVLFALPPQLLAAAQADISKWLAGGTRIHNIAGHFALSETAQAHLAVEKGDKLGTVIVDCAR